jgi:hypothetical protein|tara:strand:+ start:565 stop:702 length:138 start_codon:yes stop_codon:yes gene_type:complete
MPLPKPKPNEKQSDFMTRCLEVAMTEFPEDQAVAVCYAQFRKKQK